MSTVNRKREMDKRIDSERQEKAGDSAILLALDDYDDIFSDFDIRSYNVRAISIDLLEELKWRLRRVPKPTRLIFTLPHYRRRKHLEPKVARRLRTFFKMRTEAHEESAQHRIIRGIWLFLLGFILYLALFALTSWMTSFELVYDFALFPSWYLAWAGFDDLLEGMKEKSKNYYKVLAQVRIEFKDEENYEQ